MKKVVLAAILLLGMTLPAYAVNVSINSAIQVTNAPTNSKWQTECGPSTGVYNSIKQFSMNNIGSSLVAVSSIFDVAGTYFCRTAFVQQYGQGPYSTEITVVVTTPTLSAPSLTVVP
jgi:hypothetical protein